MLFHYLSPQISIHQYLHFFKDIKGRLVLAAISKDEDERAKFRSRRKAETDRISDLLTSEENGAIKERAKWTVIVADKDAKWGAVVADKDAKWGAVVADKDAEIADKDAEIAKLRALLGK